MIIGEERLIKMLKRSTEVDREQACAAGDVIFVTRMIEHNVQLSENCLTIACSYNQLEVIKLLLQAGVKVTQHAIAQYCHSGDQINVLQALLSVCNKTDDYAIRNAAGKNKRDFVDLLLSHGATISDESVGEALLNGHLDMGKYLLSLGAKLADYSVQFAIVSANLGHDAVSSVKLLLEAGAKILDANFETAARWGMSEVLELLLNNSTCTSTLAVTYACDNSEADCLRLLLEHKAPVSRLAMSRAKKAPASSKRDECVELLKQHKKGE